MNFKKITVIALIVLLMCSLIMHVNAEEITASTYWKQQSYNNTFSLKQITQQTQTGNTETFTFNTVENMPYVSVFFIGTNATTPNNGYFYLIVYHKSNITIRSTDGQITGEHPFYCTKAKDKEELNTYLFNKDITSLDSTSSMKSYAFQTIIKNDYTVGGYTGSEGDTSATAITLEEYYIENIKTNDDTGGSDNEEDETGGTGGGSSFDDDDKFTLWGWLETLMHSIQAIPDNILEGIRDIFKITNGTIVFDKAGELINDNLKDNEFYTSILSIRYTLQDLFNEDYTDHKGFYELGLTNIKLDKMTVYYDYVGGSHTSVVEEDPPFKIEEGKVLNLDWYFGVENNNYVRRGMKKYIDNIISAFLWLMFAWALYKNMPNWISGELTQISNLASNTYSTKERKINTKLPSLNDKEKK